MAAGEAGGRRVPVFDANDPRPVRSGPSTQDSRAQEADFGLTKPNVVGNEAPDRMELVVPHARGESLDHLVFEEIEGGEHERGPDDEHAQRVGTRPVPPTQATRNRTLEKNANFIRSVTVAETFQRSARVTGADDEACLEGLFVDVSVEDAVLELARDIGVEEDTRRAVLDHDVACHRFVHDGVIPRSVGRRRRAGGDSESGVGAGILTDDEFENGAHRCRREREHA